MDWLINGDPMRGTVAGTISMHRSLTGDLWTGTLRGRIDDTGAKGVIQLSEAQTHQRFSGTWVSLVLEDPTAEEHVLQVRFTGTVTSH